MQNKRTFNNNVLIRLDKENDSIKTTSGFELYIDSSFEPEKHATVTGEVCGLPSRLSYTGQANIGMPWLTDIEVNYGDHVIMYYLSIINAFKKEIQKYFIKNNFHCSNFLLGILLK